MLIALAIAAVSPALLGGRPDSASARVVVKDDFAAGVSRGWTASAGRPVTRRVASPQVRRAFVTPRRRGVTYLERRLAGRDVTAVTMHVRLSGSTPQRVVALGANRIRVTLGRGRVELRVGGRVVGTGKLRRGGAGWHRLSLIASVSKQRVALTVDGRTVVARTAATTAETRVRIGDLDPRPSGPAFIGRVRVAVGGGAAGDPAPAPGSPGATPAPVTEEFHGSRFFGPGSVWNTPLTANAALDPDSSRYVRTLVTAAARPGGAWINTTEYSVPIYTVPAGLRGVNVSLNRNVYFAPEIRRAFTGVPIPPDARPAGGTDRHMIIHQPSTDTMWELWSVQGSGDTWSAGWGGRLDGVSTHSGVLTPPQSATATGLALAGGLVTLQDIARGRIDHAIALAVPEPRRNCYSLPAVKTDGYSDSADAILLGSRFRLDPNLDIDALNLPPFTRMLAVAAQTYGVVVRDTSGAVTVYGEDPTPTGTSPYPALFGGASPGDLMARFPWDRLQLLKMTRQGGC